jgi:hypothetical protein
MAKHKRGALVTSPQEVFAAILAGDMLMVGTNKMQASQWKDKKISWILERFYNKQVYSVKSEQPPMPPYFPPQDRWLALEDELVREYDELLAFYEVEQRKGIVTPTLNSATLHAEFIVMDEDLKREGFRSWE